MMGSVLTAVTFGSFGLFMFNLGLLVPILRHRWYRRKLRRVAVVCPNGEVITKDDMRRELLRDPVAAELFLDDDTPEDVQRYLYLEAERRAVMRKRKQLGNDENDFFAPPRRPGPDPGFRGCNEL